MNLIGLTRGARRVVALAVVGLPVLAGCSSANTSSPSVAPVVALRVDAPLHEPVWSDNTHTLLALTDDGRVVKLDPSGSTASTTVSAPLRDVGENISASPTGDNVVFVPQPTLGRIAVISVADLRQVATVQGATQPRYVDQDSGAKDLLAVSADGTTVTGVDLAHGNKVVTTQHVQVGPGAEVDGGKRGRRIEFHVAGPEGVALYKGDPDAVQKVGELPIPAGASASDLAKSSRLYFAQRGTGRLIAVDEGRSLHGLEMVGQAQLGEPIDYIGVDQTRIYAATEHALVVLETNSFEGYRNGVIPVVDIIDFRASLPDAIKTAPLSGIAVDPNLSSGRVYLTLQGQPDVLSIAKPSL